VIVDPRHVQLRASKARRGGQRVYTILVVCQNGAGLTEASTVVTVPHSRGH
jgi:hypothetical protein